jgi:PmbA protein
MRMTDLQDCLDRSARSLLPMGLEAVEVYLKEGRSRRAAQGSQGRLVSQHHERGWAVRASGEKSSLFCCGSGERVAAGPWPSPDGYPIRLPSPRPVSDWREPAELRSPLCVEHEALEIIEACGRELTRELPGVRLLQATLEDGESSSKIANTRGVEASWRQRAATLYLEAALDDEEVIEFVGGRNAHAFSPRALARRIADRLLIRRDGVTGARDRGTVLLAPPVAVRILGALLPVFLGYEQGLEPGRGSEHLTVVDDGRLAEGVFVAPVDGEGMPTGRTILIEKGTLRETLGPGLAQAIQPDRGAGSVRRPSYRDVPRVGPSHLFIEADRKQSVGALLAELSRGHYFLDAHDAGRFDLAGDRFEITVGGFAVRSGNPTAAISGAKLSGKFSQLLAGLRAVARDLTFFPLGGLLGSPSLLITGLEVNGRSPF